MEGRKYLVLKDISAYNLAFELSNYLWSLINEWGFFEKDTLGKQFVRSIDSISANIAEGFGRYSKKDKIRFYRISLSSLSESYDWNEKAKSRGLINDEEYDRIHQNIQSLTIEINHLIKFTNSKLKY